MRAIVIEPGGISVQKTRVAPAFILETRRFQLPGFAGVLVECDFCDDGVALGSLPQSLLRAVPKRQAEFLAGRHCARSAMEALGIEPVEVGIGKDRAPVWSMSLRGSITHTGPVKGKPAIACCVLAPGEVYRGIGIDMENIMSETIVAETAALIMDEQERALLMQQVLAQEISSWVHLVTLLFSAKESLFKALYPAVGRYFDFMDARLVALDLISGSFILELKASLADALPAGFKVHGRYQSRGLRLLTMVTY
jgi:enterobactin synthetase component D